MNKNRYVVFTNIEEYNKIVKVHYDTYLNLSTDYDRIANGKTFFDVDDETKGVLYSIERSMFETALVIICFSQMTIEAFCNAYLSEHTKFKSADINAMKFRRKIKETIIALMAKDGYVISKNKAELYFGKGIWQLLEVRNKVVHRYPLKVKFNLTSIKQFEKSSIFVAKQLEKSYIKRIDRNTIVLVARAYDEFVDNLKTSGCTFKDIRFDY